MILNLILTGFALAFFLLFFWLHLDSRSEREPVAARRSLWLGCVVAAVYLMVAWLPMPGGETVGWLLAAITFLAPVVLLVPTGTPDELPDGDPTGRLDERTIMFSRAVLEPDTERFAEYYRLYPEHRSADDHWRSLPGLMSDRGSCYEPLSFAAAAASFDTVEALAPLITGELASARQDVDAAVATRFLKGWLAKLGARDSGVTELRPTHLYSVKGRGERYGRDVDLDHRYAVAFVVEMDHANLGQAPEGPTLMESAQQYLSAGAIAVQAASFIRRLGWPAEAHIDGNYQVICPLVARDAGLGEIGRMGLLMTPRLGPRVRIAIVTTDLPLIVDRRRPDRSLLHFCSICRKCAEVCPAGALPRGEPAPVDGVPRWKIDDEACFTLWCATGTDCGKCMRACPYSHPDTVLHNLVRRGLARSGLFRHFALHMDDFLYGRRPGRLRPRAWLPRRNSRRES